MVLPTRASQLQRSEKDRWSFISECSGQAGKIAMLVGSDEIFNMVFMFSLFSSHCLNFLASKKDNMGSSCVACTMFDMRLVDGTLEHDLCFPGSEGLPAVSMCYVWPLLMICRQTCCKAKSSVPLIAMGWSVLLRLSCNHYDWQSFLHKLGDGLPLLISCQSSKKLPKVYLAPSVWRGL